MKILYTIEDISIKGGAENIIAQKANYLATVCGHEVTIVSIYLDGRPPSYPLDDNVRLVSLGIPFVERKGSATKKAIRRLLTMANVIRKFQKTVNKTKPDIIFFTLSLGALMLPFCRTKAKKVYESHSARLFTPYNRMFNMMEKKADAVVCLTEGDAREYQKARRVAVIPNFIERPRLYVGDYSVKRAIAVGRLEAAKGFDILIGCWPAIIKEHPDWHLDLYGEGSCRNDIQEQIRQLGMQRHITVCGQSDNIMEVYPRYSLHIMPSRYEGLPMTLIEAQACGLPSVVTDSKYGATDIIKNECNGIVVEQGNAKALTDAVCRMMASETLRREYGTAAKTAVQKYFKENVLGLWTGFIQTLHK